MEPSAEMPRTAVPVATVAVPAAAASTVPAAPATTAPSDPPGEGFFAIGAEEVAKLQDGLPDDELLYDLAESFRVFGDTTRIKILYALFESELCVGDLARVLGLSQSSVSHQLRLLKNSKLVKFRRAGKAIFYSLDDDHVRSMIALGLEHLEE